MNCLIGMLVAMFIANLVTIAMLLCIDHKLGKDE